MSDRPPGSEEWVLRGTDERAVRSNVGYDTENARLLREARLYGEKMLRDRDPQIQRCGADLLQIIDAPGITALPPDVGR